MLGFLLVVLAQAVLVLWLFRARARCVRPRPQRLNAHHSHNYRPGADDKPGGRRAIRFMPPTKPSL